MSIALRGLHPEVRERAQWALDYAAAYRVPVTVTSGHRSWAEQDRLRKRYENCLARGETVRSSNPNAACRYPANEPGDSAHNWRLAWDSVVPPAYGEGWKAVRRAAGFAVPDADPIHAEVPDWRTFTPYLKIDRG